MLMLGLLLAMAPQGQTGAQTASLTASAPPLALKFINPLRDFIQTGDKCYCLLPPRLVSGEDVQDAQWSQDGKSLLYVRLTQRPTFDAALSVQNASTLTSHTLYQWDEASDQSTSIVTVDGKTTSIDRLAWLNGGAVFLLETEEAKEEGSKTYAIYRFASDDPNGSFVARSAAPFEIEASPTKDEAILTEFNRDQSGQTKKAAILEDGATYLVQIDSVSNKSMFDFDENGDACYFDVVVDPTTKKRRLVARPIDAKTGHIQLDREVTSRIGAFQVPITVEPGSSLAAFAKSDKVSLESEWLIAQEKEEGEHPPQAPEKSAGKHYVAFLADDSTQGFLSSALNRVAYVSKGSLFVRDMIQIDAALMAKMIAEAEKEDAMSRAKQIGLAMIMFSNDWDGKMPSNRDFGNQIDPYLKDGDLLQGFVYTYQGGNLPEGADAASTQLGYVQQGNGRASVYGDGHVVWQ